MTEPAARIIAVFPDYLGLVTAIRARVGELGITYSTLDEIAGWHDGYSNKLLIEEPQLRGTTKNTHSQRIMGVMAFDTILGSVGVKLALVEDVRATERIRNGSFYVRRKRPMPNSVGHEYIVQRKTRENMSKMGLRSAQGRMRKLTPSKRRRLAKQAAKARWSKPKITEVKQ